MTKRRRPQTIDTRSRTTSGVFSITGFSSTRAPPASARAWSKLAGQGTMTHARSRSCLDHESDVFACNSSPGMADRFRFAAPPSRPLGERFRAGAASPPCVDSATEPTLQFGANADANVWAGPVLVQHHAPAAGPSTACPRPLRSAAQSDSHPSGRRDSPRLRVDSRRCRGQPFTAPIARPRTRWR
jgi:hypothetical protein